MTSVLKGDEIVREVIDLHVNPYVVNNKSYILIIGIDKEEIFLFKIYMKSIWERVIEIVMPGCI